MLEYPMDIIVGRYLTVLKFDIKLLLFCYPYITLQLNIF
jgi:hypothetical protein